MAAGLPKSGTSRVNLDFDAEATTPFMHWLDRQCDEQRIQGVLNVVTISRGFKAQLVVKGDETRAIAIAEAWVGGVNALVVKMTQAELDEFKRADLIMRAMAYPSDGPNIFGWKGTDDPSHKGEDGGDRVSVVYGVTTVDDLERVDDYSLD
ncbi:hypothetical protein KBD20_01395 [Candidatus Saccharibacteria bacterium]|nr:hypothetical protein [Candidatus Saccharibacteria bacterium]